MRADQPTPERRGERIPDHLYAGLCESIRMVCEEVDALPAEPPSLLSEWRAWAAVVLSGLYYRKTAERALETARRARRTCANRLPEAWLAEAAARSAEAVSLAIEGRHRMASAIAAHASSLASQTRSARRGPGAAADRDGQASQGRSDGTSKRRERGEDPGGRFEPIGRKVEGE